MMAAQLFGTGGILTGTTKEAASRMFVSQPAISRLITALEEEVGFTLFSRLKGRLQPTTAGMRFYEAVEQNFLGLERLDQTAARIRCSEPTELKIACTPALSATLLPVAIKAFRVPYPTIMINVDTVIVPDLLERIQQMRVDLAVTLAFPPITGIEVEPLLETENYCAMPISHPLASKDVINPEDLIAGALFVGTDGTKEHDLFGAHIKHILDPGMQPFTDDLQHGHARI